MIFKKPEDLKYTDICKYIDSHAYNKDCDDEKIYEYIWVLVHALVGKHCRLRDTDDYEQFTYYVANFLYLRIKNKKQYEYKKDGTVKLKRVKSILNYTKKVLPGLEVGYIKSRRTINETIQCADEIDKRNSVIYDLVDRSSYNINKVEFNLYLDDICDTIKYFISRTPYKGTDEFNNLYISCLMSLLNSMTLRRTSIDYINRECTRNTITDSVIVSLYEKELEDFVILYHLPECMKGYVRVLSLRLRDIIGEDLSYILHTSPYSEEEKIGIVSEIISEVDE